MVAIDVLLLQRWSREGDPEAFNELVRRHANMVYTTCLRILKNRADAEEVAQECFLQLAKSGNSVRSSIGGWLHVLATHRSINRIKSDSRRREREQEFAEESQFSQRAEWSALMDVVDESIAELPEKLREVIVAHFLEQRSHESIADDLGIPRRTVSYRIAKGIERIRINLQKKGVRAEFSALAGMLRAGSLEPAPQSLASSLGKLALSGMLPSALGKAAASSGAFLASLVKSVIVTAILGLATYVAYVSVRDKRVTWRDIQRQEEGVQQTVDAISPEPEAPTSLSKGATPTKTPEVTAPTLASDEISDPSQYIAISGKVTDENGQPVPWTRVLLVIATRRSRVYEANTDASGRYVFTEVKHTGDAKLVAAKHGYMNDIKAQDLKAGEVYKDVDFSIRPGLAVEGVLIAPDGKPVPDGVLCTSEVWNEDNYTPEYTGAFSVAVTDSVGRFDLGVDAKAAWAHVWANSEMQGGDCFSRVALAQGNVELRMKEKAKIHGKVLWQDGSPAVGKLVAVQSRLPEPDTRTIRTGMRVSEEQRALVASNGTYEFTDLYPAMTHDLFVVENEKGKDVSVSIPLATPLSGLKLSPGEDAEKDFTVAKSGAVAGRVLTEKTHRAVPETMLFMQRTDSQGYPQIERTDKNGNFTFRCASGDYVLFAGVTTFDGDSALVKRFGKPVSVGEGATVNQDLLVPEPLELPLRILNHEGKPVAQAIIETGIVTPDGRRYGTSVPQSIDAGGHVNVLIYQELVEVWASAGTSHQGPRVETPHFKAKLGDVLPEETLVLEATCTVRGVVVDAAGKPIPDRGATIKAIYEDGSTNTISVGLNAAGEFSALPGIAEVRAATATFEVSVSDVDGLWRSEQIECLPDESVDLGTIVIASSPPDADEPNAESAEQE
ncbi:MAG: sigma-70 family RNA polymerase sigma factor [Candidatus Hydrogenedentes bacterium]|nr:sigma-70 family RNA polymerase sigma factor [Candidatus Hydrogenedentota bacterium]